MALFGSFETEREVYSDLVYAVYTARKDGDPNEEYAVKVFRLPDRGLEAELAPGAGGREELERSRLSSINVQEQAAAGSAFIAPVLEKGSDSRGLWYATRFYSRSVNKMMSGKVALPRASLEHLIRSIAQGALDLKRSCGRSHGDIRPTNVQVSKSEKLTEAEVVLCDPLPGGPEEAQRYELSDLHAIGLILLQLVRQRMISGEDAGLMLPISPGTEWTRVFGSDASDWLAICNRLLDPGLSAEQFPLEALMARLNELKPKRGGSRKLVLAGVAALILALVVGLWGLRPRMQSVEITSDPPGATISVDQTKQMGTTPLRLRLRRGNHVIEARHDQLGLAETATNCVVQSGESTAVHFQFAYGSVSITSDPPGATILKEGVAIGRTTMDGHPFVLPTAVPGPVKYQLNLDNYEEAEVSGVVSNRQKLELQASLRRREPVTPPVVAESGAKNAEPPLPAKPGSVELRSEPVPALILDAEGRELGHASSDAALRLTVAAGQHSFTARAVGLDDVVATLPVQPEVTTPYTFNFNCGTVEWMSEPVPATVSLGGQSRLTPATFVQKPGVINSYVLSASGFRTVTNQVTVQSGEHKKMPVTLVPLMISVGLVSDPPGAEFFTEDGTALARSGTNDVIYQFPPGPVNLVARYARLGAVTNHVTLTPEKTGSQLRFKFDYGILVLTNLPPDMLVYEGDAPVGTAADKAVYQKPGAHAYALRSRAGSQNLQTNIGAGLNFLRLVVTAEKAWKNSLGMYFAWVPNLPGGGAWPGQTEPGGWVGVSELTQGQYKKMDGSNPSFYQEGGDNFPVENLTWEQARNYCRWLSSADTAERLGWRYALPTDEQFAAFAADADRLPRVTNEGRMSGSSSDDIFSLQRGAKIPAAANLNSARTHPESVGSTKRSNQFGLYDVTGNVWEWLGRSAGKETFYAGGSYLNFSAKTVVAKARERTFEKGPNIGFRVVLVPAQ